VLDPKEVFQRMDGISRGRTTIQKRFVINTKVNPPNLCFGFDTRRFGHAADFLELVKAQNAKRSCQKRERRSEQKKKQACLHGGEGTLI